MSENQEQVADDVALDMDGYVRLGRHRRAFDDWLRAEGLIDQNIFYMRFREGYIEAKCYLQPPTLADDGDGPAWEWRRFVTTGLPGFDPTRIRRGRIVIVECAYCGRLPLTDLEELMELAWPKHVRECHPDWCPPDGYLAEALRQFDGFASHSEGETTNNG